MAQHNKQFRFIESNQTDVTNNPVKAKEMDMGRAYIEKRPGKHHQTSTTLEPTGKEEKMKAKKYLAQNMEGGIEEV